MGWDYEFQAPQPTIAPQNPASRLLVREEGFGDVGPTSRLDQVPYLIAVCVLPFAWEMCRIKRRYFIFHPRSVL